MSYHPGRPREFTHQKRCELLDHIGQGSTAEEAAQIVGVSLRTVQREAKHNDSFHHDLHLALHAAPPDPHKLMLRAARTHWRAAAWLLERTDPDRFAKRPPNSLSPETLLDVSAWLIETALEATPPDHRETVYRRLRAVADKALDVLMPDGHEARRCLVGALPDRPMPLSDHEAARTLRVAGDRHARAIGVQTDCAGRLPAAAAAGELATAMPTANSSPRLTTAANDPKPIADPVAYDRAQPPQTPPAGRPNQRVADFRLLDSDQMDAAWRYPTPEEVEATDADSAHHNEATAADSTDRGRSGRPWDAVRASPGPPSRGIMSPKMSAASNLDAAETATPPVTSRRQPDPPAIPIGSQASLPPSAICSSGIRRGASASA